MQVICPLEVWVSSNKKFILNLNNYRNTHFRVLTKAKKEYSALLAPQLRNKQCFDKVKLTYTLYPKTARILDVSNPCSIIDKFACDALVQNGVLPDDNYKHVVEISFKFGAVDKDNPRCELSIDEFCNTC